MSNPLDLITKERLIDLTKTLVSFRSITGEEKALGDWMVEFFESIGLEGVQRQEVEDSGDNIVGWIDGPADKPAMLLNFHLDTFDICQGWETDPFEPTLIENRLYGLGSHDMKGGGACILGAVEAIIQSGVSLGGRLIVATTTDEENWSRGAHVLINSGLLEGCHYGLVPEPTGHGELRVGQRGRHVFDLALYGRQAHASYEQDDGINAVIDAAKVACRLAKVNFKALGYSEEFDATGTLMVTGLHGGSTDILVPEEAHVYIDRHILPDQTVELAAEQIRKIIEEAGIGSTYDLKWDERPTPAPTSYVVPGCSRLVETVTRNMTRELGDEVTHVLGKSVNDASHFTVHGNVPCLLYGPQGGNTCKANEYVDVDSLPAVARTYAQSVLDLLAAEN